MSIIFVLFYFYLMNYYCNQFEHAIYISLHSVNALKENSYESHGQKNDTPSALFYLHHAQSQKMFTILPI